MGKFRILKIHSKFRYRRWGSDYFVPEIRLEGLWLEQLGFKKGDTVKIDQEKNKLIITVNKEKEHNTVYKK
ncbi:SymE family type I addiction module toxin [Aquimarina hainanensis]|uniref:SymE family type I addiction module toxin n=1 Tax=Aquimarina hainanensis TaxID=1578017 RepID=A0ABW5NGT0_9FLAO